MNLLRLIIILLALSSYTLIVQAQGCSDAGACSMNSFQPTMGIDETDVSHHRVTVGSFWGRADNTITVYGGYAEYRGRFDARLVVDARITSLAQQGNDIATFGMSDIVVNASYAASEDLQLTVGAKVPLSRANTTLDQRSLPMDYQSSLGTVDAIVGIGYSWSDLHIVAVLQQPLTQNSNQFRADDYPPLSPLRDFQTTRDFRRAADLVLRISYPLHLHANVRLTPSLVPIYHLADDTYRDENNVERSIAHSQGLTVNGTFFLDVDVSRSSTIQLSVAAPLIVRDARPDGLTRSILASLEYSLAL
jgi:hypothetical protein